MAFDWRGLLRFCRRVLLETKNTNRRLSPKRVAWLLFAYAFYPLFELVTWVGLGLDELVHPDYRRQEVSEPIFIIGNPRSGTTFLHRLMARDESTFACMNTWEILLAPSIVSRRLVKGSGALVGLELRPVYARVLDEETERARHYPSRHRYSLKEVGLSRERILAECKDVFDRLGFDRRE